MQIQNGGSLPLKMIGVVAVGAVCVAAVGLALTLVLLWCLYGSSSWFFFTKWTF